MCPRKLTKTQLRRFLMSTVNPVRNNAGCCEGAYNMASNGTNKVVGWSKSAYASAGSALSTGWQKLSTNVSAAVRWVFAHLAVAKDHFFAFVVRAKNAIVALPKEGKIAAAVAVVVSAVTTALCCKKSDDVVVERRTTEELEEVDGLGNVDGYETKTVTRETIIKQ